MRDQDGLHNGAQFQIASHDQHAAANNRTAGAHDEVTERP
jgi:hypothetical protein